MVTLFGLEQPFFAGFAHSYRAGKKKRKVSKKKSKETIEGFGKGDLVQIVGSRSLGGGLKGKITTLGINGAIIKLDKDYYTPVKFKHLKKIKELRG